MSDDCNLMSESEAGMLSLSFVNYNISVQDTVGGCAAGTGARACTSICVHIPCSSLSFESRESIACAASVEVRRLRTR